MFCKPTRKVNRVFLHCSSSDIPSHDDVEVIRAWHLNRGFDDIGYHFFIHKNGKISRGRDMEKTPASQKGHNIGTISICLHGYRIEKFTYAQFKSLKTLALEINKAYYERISFHGHCEVSSRACPIFARSHPSSVGTHKDRTYQIWQEGYQPKLIQTDGMMINKINYIHHNPVKRGYVDEAKHWRYSSARDYEGIDGLIEVEKFW